MLLITAFSVYMLIWLGECKEQGNLRKPQKLSSCKAQLDDGRIFDLSSLDNPNKLRFFCLHALYAFEHV